MNAVGLTSTPPLATPRLGLHLSNRGSARDAVALAQAAESQGLAAVWLAEDLFFRGAMPIAGAVAAATSKIEIGFGVLTPYNRHVSLLAMDLAALVDIAGPRIRAGVGAGVEVRTRAMDIEYGSPVLVVRELVETLRRLLAGECVTATGGVHRLRELGLSFEDLPPQPPIYVAAIGPKALAQAGGIADGVVLSVMASRAYITQAHEVVARGMAEAGRSGRLPIVAYLPLSVDSDGDVAIRRVKPLLAYYLRRMAPIKPIRRLFAGWGSLSPDEALAIAGALEAGAAPEAVISDALVLEHCIAGDPGQCARQVRQFAHAGVTDLALMPAGDDERGALETITALGAVRRSLAEAERGEVRA